MNQLLSDSMALLSTLYHLKTHFDDWKGGSSISEIVSHSEDQFSGGYHNFCNK